MKKILILLVAVVALGGCMTSTQKAAIQSTAELQALTTERTVAALATVPDTDQNKIDALAGNQQLLRSMRTLVQSADLDTQTTVTVTKALEEATQIVIQALLKAGVPATPIAE